MVVVVLPTAFSFRAAVVVGFCFIVRCELCPGDRHTYLVGAKGSHLTPKATMSVLKTLDDLPFFIQAILLLVLALQGAAFLAWFLMLRQELMSDGSRKKEKTQ